MAQPDICQPAACSYGWTPDCLVPADPAKLDYVFSYAWGIVTATRGLLEHEGLDVPVAALVDIAPVDVPEAAKGGCGCQGISVGIGPDSNATDYDNCAPLELWTPYEVRVYTCRARTAETGTARPVPGDAGGATLNTLSGATLETSRIYMALRKHLIRSLSGLSGCPKRLDCATTKKVVYSFKKSGDCNYVGAKFSVKV